METVPSPVSAPGFAQIAAYHERTKHTLAAYAKGPESLDWSAQPDPFRTFGTERFPLVLNALTIELPYADLANPARVASQALTPASISMLLELSLAISAWKEYGPDRWALRCNPSSGNLHPTEGYILTQCVPGLPDGLYHYLSRDHVLERRFLPASVAETKSNDTPRLWLGLSSIHWREAWKYGERAFRYCQLDLGHALGAIAYAAAILGWRAQMVDSLSTAEIGTLLGLDRQADFQGAEAEDPEVMIGLCTDSRVRCDHSIPAWAATTGTWYGQANVLDPHPVYRWPLIDEVAMATRKPATTATGFLVVDAPLCDTQASDTAQVATLIRQRRSAQAFDPRYFLPLQSFYAILMDLLPARPVPTHVIGCQTPHIHPVVFVHRVEDIAPGLYALPRSTSGEALLRATLHPDFGWQKPVSCPAQLPLFSLMEGDGRAVARTISCHQRIAADSAFALGMLATFRSALASTPWHYRTLFWEAGVVGQALYLAAERYCLRGTGIGCYFDDTFHELLGIESDQLQSLYHFTVGLPLEDTRILSLPAYPDAFHARSATTGATAA